MKLHPICRFAIAAVCHNPFLFAELPLGSQVPACELKTATVPEEKDWASESEFKKGIVQIIFYVSPAQKDINELASSTLKAQNYSKEQVKSWAIINMKSSNWPNFILSSKIAASQKEFPKTTYLKDYDETLQNKWQFAPNSNDVLVIDQEGKVIFAHNGQLDNKKVAEVLGIINKRLKDYTTVISKAEPKHYKTKKAVKK